MSAGFPGPVAGEESAPAPLLLVGFRVVPMAPAGPASLAEAAVLVRDGMIEAVGPAAEVAAPPDAVVIEGRGRTLLPGLIDMHVHVWDEAELPAFLAAGVTTVRNASGMPFHLRLRERLEAEGLVGPRLVTTGPILNSRGPNEQVNHQFVETAEQARAAVRQQHAQGYRRLKVYSNLTREAYGAILAEARVLGMTVMGHTPEGRREPGIPQTRPFNIAFEEVLDDGFVTIEHIESIVWHGLADALDETKARAIARRIAAAGVAVTPTLVAHRNLVEVASSGGAFLRREGTETLNPFLVENERSSYEFWSGQPGDGRRAHDAFYQRTLSIFHEEGVRLVAGSDAGIFTNPPGTSLLRELELYVHAGLTPLEALETATVNAAEALGEGRRLGRVAPGFAADLMIVDGDPLDRVSDLRKVAGVIARGYWHDVDELRRRWAAAAPDSYERTRLQVAEGLAEQGGTLP